MNQTVLNYILKTVAIGIQIQASGLTDQLRDDLSALVQEAKDSILEPQENGEPWTDEAILAWKAAHDQLIAQIRDRHDG